MAKMQKIAKTNRLSNADRAYLASIIYDAHFASTSVSAPNRRWAFEPVFAQVNICWADHIEGCHGLSYFIATTSFLADRLETLGHYNEAYIVRGGYRGYFAT